MAPQDLHLTEVIVSLLLPVNRNYKCSISETEELGDQFYASGEKDGLEDLPIGWTAITIKRRLLNPKFQQLFQMRELLVADMLTRVGKSPTEAQRIAVELQVEAQFAAIMKDTPVHLTEHEVAFIAPLEQSDEMLREVYNEIRSTLNLPLLGTDGLAVLDEDEDDDDDEANDEIAASVEKKPSGAAQTTQGSGAPEADGADDAEDEEDEDAVAL